MSQIRRVLPATSDQPPAQVSGPPAEAVRFLKFLDPNTDSFTFQSFDDDADRDNRDLVRVFNGTLEQHHAKLQRLSDQGAGIYVTVNETDLQARTADNVIRVRHVFVDLDGSPLQPVLDGRTPHAVIESSPGKWHCYWRVDGLSKDDFRAAQKYLIAKYRGDNSIHDLPRVMRLPGYVHQKKCARKNQTGEKHMVRVFAISDIPPYPASEIELASEERAVAPADDNPFLHPPSPRPDDDDPEFTLQKVKLALATIRSLDDYGSWFKVACCLKSQYAEEGRSLFHDWSSYSPKYDEQQADRKWDEIPLPNKYTIGTLFYLAEQANADWRLPLKKKKKKASASFLKVVKTLQEHDSWTDVLVYDVFAQKIIAQLRPPWDAGRGEWEPRPWTDHDDLETLAWLQENKISAGKGVVQDAVVLVAMQREVHPVKDYLSRLVWDGTPRLDAWMVSYLGVRDNAYTRAVSACYLISAVARIFQPGCKVDNFPILEGRQGALKSTAARTMFHPWFTDDVDDLGSKDSAMQLHGMWCIELPELDAMGKNAVSKVKAFVSRQVDRFRPPYGRHVQSFARQSVFFGTVNHEYYLKDETGNRRAWPVRVGSIDIAGLAQARDQLWAEARDRYRRGDKWWITDRDILRLAEAEQEDRRQGDPWEEPIRSYLVGREDASVQEVLRIALGRDEAVQTQSDGNRVMKAFRVLGWERFKKRNAPGWRERDETEFLSGYYRPQGDAEEGE